MQLWPFQKFAEREVEFRRHGKQLYRSRRASGKVLWHFQCGAAVYGSSMSFAIDGKQYVAVAAGSAPFTFGSS